MTTFERLYYAMHVEHTMTYTEFLRVQKDLDITTEEYFALLFGWDLGKVRGLM